MNTKKLWVVLVTGLSLIALAGCATTQPTSQEETESQAVEQSPEVIVDATAEETTEQDDTSIIQTTDANAWLYANYSQVAVDEALADGKKVALFFHATRCPSCRNLDKEINQNLNELPEGTALFKLDYDVETELRQQYGVTMQHTIVVIDADKNEVEKDAWSADLDKVVSMLE